MSVEDTPYEETDSYVAGPSVLPNSLQPSVIGNIPWDPTSSKDWEAEKISIRLVMRIKR